jgi:hypothetical protein
VANGNRSALLCLGHLKLRNFILFHESVVQYRRVACLVTRSRVAPDLSDSQGFIQVYRLKGESVVRIGDDKSMIGTDYFRWWVLKFKSS